MPSVFGVVFATLLCIIRATTPDALPTYQSIEGRVSIPKQFEPIVRENWQARTRVLVNHGQYQAFVRDDGQFRVDGLPVGASYIVEVADSDFLYEPVRVDINSKGKQRARKLNLLQPAQVSTLSYPLKMTARAPATYFRRREEWSVFDMLKNPMVLVMVLPMLLFMLLPKLINTNDPEIQREMQQSMQMPKYELPELSEVMANWFGGGDAKSRKKVKQGPAAAAIKQKR